MMYATTQDGDRIEAEPRIPAACPSCASPVVAKCGEVVRWHWAHRAREDCDSWAEPDSSWHRTWQECVPSFRREVVMGPHRADVVTASGWVVELQHSAISPAEIAERERFYGARMVWVFDASEAWHDQRLYLCKTRDQDGKKYVTFRWKHPRKTIALCNRRVLLDTGTGQLLSVRHIYPDGVCGGWGYMCSTDSFREWIAGSRENSVREYSGTGQAA
jgi:competence protein CoiA